MTKKTADEVIQAFLDQGEPCYGDDLIYQGGVLYAFTPSWPLAIFYEGQIWINNTRRSDTIGPIIVQVTNAINLAGYGTFMATYDWLTDKLKEKKEKDPSLFKSLTQLYMDEKRGHNETKAALLQMQADKQGVEELLRLEETKRKTIELERDQLSATNIELFADLNAKTTELAKLKEQIGNKKG